RACAHCRAWKTFVQRGPPTAGRATVFCSLCGCFTVRTVNGIPTCWTGKSPKGWGTDPYEFGYVGVWPLLSAPIGGGVAVGPAPAALPGCGRRGRSPATPRM
ncbi:hypothetical protein AALO_G00207180, partial [Alosa alosa]